jgi:tyrosyl-tRNA synthetase
MSLISDLQKRGLIHQGTDLDGLTRHLEEKPRKIYCGFDPTASSLTIGNLVPILILAHFQRAGHTPVVVMGGATGLIGDPSGKSAERPLLDYETVSDNVQAQRRIFEQILDFDPSKPNHAIIVNNSDWLSRLSFVDALRDLGKHFSVNQMIGRDSVRERLAREQGISYTEFSYMLLQAYDFQHLFQSAQVTVQLGGSDQWGNIVPGVDLVRRTCRAQAFGLTCPLVTRADGGKFGKTEAGPVWLSADRTSPYALYQFFLNTSDADIGRFLRLFTTVPLKKIEEFESTLTSQSSLRLPQQTLAREVVGMVHGQSAAAEAERASQALFTGDLESLSSGTLDEVLAGLPTQRNLPDSFGPDGISAVELLCLTPACNSRREARELLAAGAVSLNGRTLEASEIITRRRLLHDRFGVIRRGKKHWSVGIWE